MHVEDGIFVAKTVGDLDNMDARTWANALRKNDTSSAIVDMTEVNRICPTVPKMFADAIRLPNLRTIAVIVNPNMSSQNQRIVDKLTESSHVRVFTNAEDARMHAQFYANKGGASAHGAGVAAATYATSYSMNNYASNFTFSSAASW